MGAPRCISKAAGATHLQIIIPCNRTFCQCSVMNALIVVFVSLQTAITDHPPLPCQRVTCLRVASGWTASSLGETGRSQSVNDLLSPRSNASFGRHVDTERSSSVLSTMRPGSGSLLANRTLDYKVFIPPCRSFYIWRII